MPQGPTTNYQGGQSMVRNNPAAESWGAFVRKHMAALGMKQAELRRAMEAEGFPISRQAASQWFNGENAADPNMATIVATVLHADPAEALRAAGYAIAVERMRPDRGDNDATHRAVIDEPVDPTIEEILGMTFLGAKVRRALIDQYLADKAVADQMKEDARQRARNLAKAWSTNGDDSNDSAA